MCFALARTPAHSTRHPPQVDWLTRGAHNPHVALPQLGTVKKKKNRHLPKNMRGKAKEPDLALESAMSLIRDYSEHYAPRLHDQKSLW